MWKVCLQKCKKILKNYILYLKDGLITGQGGAKAKLCILAALRTLVKQADNGVEKA